MCGDTLKKTLIAIGTRYGATEEVAAVIQKIMEKKYNMKVEIFNLKIGRACPDLDDYSSIIIGSGIKYGKWTENAEKFLEDPKLTEKKVAIFISSNFAGEAELYDHAYKNFLEGVVKQKSKLTPIAMEAFGGRVPRTHIPKIWYDRIMQRLPEFQYDNRDWEKIEKWANEVGKKFSEE